MKKVLMLFAASLVFAVISHGQTLSPVISECTAKKCSGSFTVTNNGVTPLPVTLEAHSFSLDASGQTAMRALDSAVSLNLDETSARVPAKSSHQFSYKLTCSAAPCLVKINALMAVGKSQDGLLVRVGIPLTLYVCEKQKDCRANTLKAAGLGR